MNTQNINPETGSFLSLREFVANYQITEIVPEVRENSNGYTFVTFVNHKNNAENVYFGSSIAKDYSAGMPITKDLLDKLQVYEYLRDDGKQGLRLVRKGVTRVAISGLI